MPDLVRKIEPDDIPKLQNLCKLIFKDENWIDIKRLDGMTNHSYRITRMDGSMYLFRIPGEGTEKMINRSDERKSTELGCKLGIDSPLIYFGDDGCKVMQFIHDPQPMSGAILQKKAVLKQAAHIFRRLHSCGVDTGVHFEVFEMAKLYEKIIKEATVSLYKDYEAVRQTVMEIKDNLDKDNENHKVPCHNDSLIGNWVLDGNGKLFLIDWEYSGMNDAMWDLSCLSIEAKYSIQNDIELLSEYYGQEPSVSEVKKFTAFKLYVDYLWTLWGLTRIPYDGIFMQQYADNRYNRLKKNILAYKQI